MSPFRCAQRLATIDAEFCIVTRGIDHIAGGGVAEGKLPVAQIEKIGRGEDRQGDAQRPGQPLLVAEDETARIRVKPVGADDEIEPLRRPLLKSDDDARIVLFQRDDRIAIDIGRDGRAGLQQKPGEIVAQDLDVAAVQSPGADRALFGARQFLAVDVDHRHALQMRAHRAHLIEQPHFAHDGKSRPANVDRLPARARHRRPLDHGDLEAAFS